MIEIPGIMPSPPPFSFSSEVHISGSMSCIIIRCNGIYSIISSPWYVMHTRISKRLGNRVPSKLILKLFLMNNIQEDYKRKGIFRSCFQRKLCRYT